MEYKTFSIIEFVQRRPLSWSALSSFEYNPEQWFKKYVLKEEQNESAEMIFGKKFADSCEIRKPLAPVTLLSKMEHEFRFMFNDVPMIGYADTHSIETRDETGEYKTGVKAWDQKRVDEHGQIDMYALGNFILHKVRPEECAFWLEWIPTRKMGNYSIDFVRPIKVHHFDTRRTTRDILKFGVRVNQTLREMEAYVRNHN